MFSSEKKDDENVPKGFEKFLKKKESSSTEKKDEK